MIKSKEEKASRPREIDLSGPDGNVFYLMALASRWGKQLRLDTDEIIKDMKSADYEHAINVFDKHFGSVVTLYR